MRQNKLFLRDSFKTYLSKEYKDITFDIKTNRYIFINIEPMYNIITDIKDKECIICLCEYDEHVLLHKVSNTISHSVCKSCYEQGKKTKSFQRCPICRHQL